MVNRINCPHCMKDGEIMTAVCEKTSERIYMCDRCKDIWETLDFSEEKSLSYDTYMLKVKKNMSDFISWEYVIR